MVLIDHTRTRPRHQNKEEQRPLRRPRYLSRRAHSRKILKALRDFHTVERDPS